MTAAAAAGPATDRAATAYDGVATVELAGRIGAARLHLYECVGSTMDVAHSLAAAGAPGGTAVLADMQLAGRGRQGRAWRSEAGQGVWITLLERPADASALEVMSLRVGLAIAEALEPLALAPLQLKWPNDIFSHGRKLAGILIEARWRQARLDWVAVGIGLNVRPPAGRDAASLAEGVSRVEALERLVPAVRSAAATTGALSANEVARFHARDLAVGRAVVAPSPGVVAGVDASGAIAIVGPAGTALHRAGSLVLAEDA